MRKVNKWVFWTPRILSILFICFLALMSLDVFDSGLSFWQTVVGLFMHNIPAFILLIALVISWKYEWVGGVIFILAGVVYIALLLISVLKSGFEWYLLFWAIQIAGLAFFIGILFMINWRRKKKMLF